MTTAQAFESALVEGHEAEARIAAAFYGAGWVIRRANMDGSMDLVVSKDGLPWPLEVKNENRYADSENVALELYQGKGERRRPSCLSISESRVCIHTMGDMAVCFRTQQMRLFLKEKAHRYPVRGFDAADNANLGVLFPIRDGVEHNWFGYCRIEELPECQVFRGGARP